MRAGSLKGKKRVGEMLLDKKKGYEVFKEATQGCVKKKKKINGSEHHSDGGLAGQELSLA